MSLAVVLSSAASCLLPEARLTESGETRELLRAGAGGETSSEGGTSSVNAAGGTYRPTNEAGAAGVLNGTGNTAGAGARPSERDAGQSSAVDVDGGSACGSACGAGEACVIAEDCESGVCAGLGCSPGTSACCQAPSCDDGVANGTETGVDCGGISCPRCADLVTCAEHADCLNNSCSSGICISCGDGAVDGTETDIDCGGNDPFCRRCLAGEGCGSNTDCASGFCFDGSCG